MKYIIFPKQILSVDGLCKAFNSVFQKDSDSCSFLHSARFTEKSCYGDRDKNRGYFYLHLVASVLLSFLSMLFNWCAWRRRVERLHCGMVCSFLTFLIPVELSACGLWAPASLLMALGLVVGVSDF